MLLNLEFVAAPRLVFCWVLCGFNSQRREMYIEIPVNKYQTTLLMVSFSPLVRYKSNDDRIYLCI